MPTHLASDASVTGFAEFVNLIESLHLVSGSPIFRGQAVKGMLLPGIARQDAERDTTELERTMLDQLSLVAASQLPNGLTELDLMVIAQHHGMKTRLLDWTSNPLAALWFACNDRTPGDVFVYVFDTQDALMNQPYTSSPFDHGQTKVFQPRLNNSRIIAQQGWFTLHCFSPRSARWVPLEKNSDLKLRLITIEIPEASRPAILQSIARHGTSTRTLFPDLDGVCKHLNWLHGVA